MRGVFALDPFARGRVRFLSVGAARHLGLHPFEQFAGDNPLMVVLDIVLWQLASVAFAGFAQAALLIVFL